MAVLVFANGNLEDGVTWIRPFLAGATAIIAADGGLNHLQLLNHVPDVLIGDLDSVDPAALAGLDRSRTKLVAVPPAKDETDLELALLYAVEHFEDEILIIGALGGRLDQMLANLLLLAHPRLQERPIRLLTRYQQAWLVTDRTEINGIVGDTVSLIPLGGNVVVADSAGLEWPLRRETLLFGPARGISNVMTMTTAVVELASGRLLCVHTKKEWRR